MNKLTVLDIYCGAGGFSEGFRQQGFEIVGGVDKWEPAIETYNHNFGLDCVVKDVLDFEHSVEEIEKLPNTDVLIGSPPCVTFSSSNKSGKADKSLGVRLTEIYLRIIAVKKYSPDSKLKAWFMENVVNSMNYLNDYYTFKDLGLSAWAKELKLSPNKKAIILKGNQSIINSADYGSAQKRKRVVSGEIISLGSLLLPSPTYKSPDEDGKLLEYKTLGFVKNALPKPNERKSSRFICDPLYPMIKIKTSDISDHFYDTGLYQCEWKNSKFLKVNHPYMGRMSFPENEEKPSRTITATKIGTSREAIIFKSEHKRSGNGAYRIPTIREAASIMGFPLTYQFVGTEGMKCALVGNAVCPTVSRAFAKQLRKTLGLPEIKKPKVQLNSNLQYVNNLNVYAEKIFDKPPQRLRGSRYRRHPFKDGHLTVTLSNYDIEKNEKEAGRWRTSVQYGNGEGFPHFGFPDGFYKKIENMIKEFDQGTTFLDVINNGFTLKVGRRKDLQSMYELQRSQGDLIEPTELMEKLAYIINNLKIDEQKFIQNGTVIFKNKKVVPVKQLFALYAINKISSIANR